jgi:hypothetical protein
MGPRTYGPPVPNRRRNRSGSRSPGTGARWSRKPPPTLIRECGAIREIVQQRADGTRARRSAGVVHDPRTVSPPVLPLEAGLPVRDVAMPPVLGAQLRVLSPPFGRDHADGRPGSQAMLVPAPTSLAVSIWTNAGSRVSNSGRNTPATASQRSGSRRRTPSSGRSVHRRRLLLESGISSSLRAGRPTPGARTGGAA